MLQIVENVDEFEKRRNLVLKVVHDEIDKLGIYIKKYEGTNSIAYTEFYFKKKILLLVILRKYL